MQDWRTNRYGGKFQVEVDENGKIIEKVTWMPIKKNGEFIKKNTKPWEAMKRNGKIVKKTIEIPNKDYSKEEIEYENGYKKNENEIKSAKFVQGLSHKKVKMLSVKSRDNLNPDAMVDGKYVDFKNPKSTSKNGIDSLTRHGLRQINRYGNDKAGFVFHWADDLQQSKNNIDKQVIDRMQRSEGTTGQVHVKKKKRLFIYKKREI